MSKPYTGGCACGQVRYTIAAEPMLMVDCQCRQCQRATGAGHGSYLNFPRAAAQIEGTPASWSLVGDGGTKKTDHFCATCGAPVFLTLPDMDVIAVRAGSLDDPSRYAPQMLFWHAAGHAWDRVDPELQTFDKMPPPRAG